MLELTLFFPLFFPDPFLPFSSLDATPFFFLPEFPDFSQRSFIGFQDPSSRACSNSFRSMHIEAMLLG